MKRIYSFMVAAVASFAAISCTQELQDNNQLPEGEVVVFEATVDGAGTKAVLDGTVSKWEETDKITIISENGAYEFATSADDLSDDATSATFKYVGDDFAGTKFMAVYPAGDNYTAEVESKTLNAEISKWQEAKTGSKNPAIAVAYTEDNTLAFKNTTALLKFTLNMDNITHVYFKGNNNETVAGNVEITLDKDNNVSIECLDNNDPASQTVECYWYGGTFEKGETYYVAVAPQTFESGVELKITRNVENSDPQTIVVKSTTNKVVTKVNTILDLGEIGGMSYTTDPRVEKIYLKPNADWAQDNACFAAHFYNPIGGTVDTPMTESDEYEGLYEVEVPNGADKVIFCRMNSAGTEFGWDKVWNQIDNLNIPLVGDKNVCLSVTDWTSGKWISIEDATAEPEVPEAGLETEWAIVGAFSSWADKTMLTTEEADVVVLKDVTMKAAEGFLVRKPSTDWADKYGAGNVNYIKTNHYITTSKGGADMCLEADGTYDIYFNISTKNIYVMTVGTDYTTATEQTVSGEEPKQEEPEVTEKVVYLKPNSNWTQSNARFAAYFFGGTPGEVWVSMTAVGDGTYEVHLPEGYDYGCNIIFCRMNPSTTANNWNNKWNQTSDLKTPTDGTNLYTVKAGTWDKGGGAWSVK